MSAPAPASQTAGELPQQASGADRSGQGWLQGSGNASTKQGAPWKVEIKIFFTKSKTHITIFSCQVFLKCHHKYLNNALSCVKFKECFLPRVKNVFLPPCLELAGALSLSMQPFPTPLTRTVGTPYFSRAINNLEGFY